MPVPQTQGTDPTFTNYAWMTGLAFCGAFMRAARWYKPDGKIDFQKVAIEIPVSIVFGAMAIAAGSYYGLAQPVVGGIAGLLGLLGPAGVDAGIQIAKTRFGGSGGGNSNG